ncbi:MAG TPA: hypothetical protein VL551_18645 [Actinospica sp.]|jgi:hypothetical protein|nr:hypothetical protein [Actinospica sp.]
MTGKTLPENASLGQLRAQAKELRRACAGGSPAALERVRAVRGDGAGSGGGELPLREAQFVVAREYGFEGWRELVEAAVKQQSGGRDLDRWFAVELNNGTWDVVDAGLSDASPREEREQALYAAYASTYHWMQAGNVANHGRGEHLVATVAVVTGELATAARHAARYAELIAAHPAAFADWDSAASAEVLARIASRSGAADAAELKAEAVRVAEAVSGDEDRRICLERLAAEPW